MFKGPPSLQSSVVLAAYTAQWLIMFVANFTPLDGHLQTSSHHGTNQHNEYDYFRQKKNHPDWSIGARNMSFSISQRADLFAPINISW